jgi:hypothetical protein
LRLCTKQKLYFAQRRGERKGRNFIFSYSLRSLRLRAQQKYIARMGVENAEEEILFFLYYPRLCAQQKIEV